MLMQRLLGRSLAALAAASMPAVSLSPASAMTLSGPSLSKSVAASQIDKVWWRGGWGGGWRGGWGGGWRGGWGGGWRGGWGWRGYGWGPAVAAGALAGAALAAPYYYGYGPGYYGYAPGAYGPCWRWAPTAYGRYEWQRMC